MLKHERPIIFGGWAIPKLLNGTKTQTRRIMKLAPSYIRKDGTPMIRKYHYGGEDETYEDMGRTWHDEEVPCPYGQVGDSLWVREAWRIGAWDEDEGVVAVDYRADGYCRREWLTVPDEGMFDRLWQQSTDDVLAAGALEDEDGKFHWEVGKSPCRWHPSIFMPRWASRLTLTVTSIRVERVSDITLADALAEGCSSLGDFAQRWDTINGKRGYGFGASPWVWAIGFRLKGVADVSVKEGARID